MPAIQQKAAVGFGGSFKKHAKDETTVKQDFSKLPPGIAQGVALLVEAKRGVYKSGKNAGKKFLHLAAIVETPETHTFNQMYWAAAENGQPAGIRVMPPQTQKVRGLRTSLTLCMDATSKTDKDGNAVAVAADENIAVVCNELRKLGGDECLDTMSALPDNATDAQANAALDAILGALIGLQPDGKKLPFIRTKFSTRAGDPSAKYPTPMVFEEWLGTDGLDAAEPNEAPPADAVDASEQPQEPVEGEQPTEGEAPVETEGGEVDWSETLASANNGDKKAQQALIDAAVEAGHSKDEAEGAADWDAVVALINNPPAAEEEAPAEEPWEPVVKETYGYKPLVKNKAGKLVPGTKQIDCSVVSVDKAKKTVVLLNGIDKKTRYQNVAWSALIQG